MSKYAFASQVQKRSSNSFDVLSIIACGVLEASNDDEAYGKALRICMKRYPTINGFFSHFIQIGDGENVIDPETVEVKQ